MFERRTPDAVRSPLPFAGVGDAHAKLARLQAVFAPELQVSRIFVRHQGAEHYISGNPGDTMNFRSQDPRAGQPRYEWEDRGEGVLYGYLIPHA